MRGTRKSGRSGITDAEYGVAPQKHFSGKRARDARKSGRSGITDAEYGVPPKTLFRGGSGGFRVEGSLTRGRFVLESVFVVRHYRVFRQRTSGLRLEVFCCQESGIMASNLFLVTCDLWLAYREVIE